MFRRIRFEFLFLYAMSTRKMPEKSIKLIDTNSISFRRKWKYDTHDLQKLSIFQPYTFTRTNNYGAIERLNDKIN